MREKKKLVKINLAKRERKREIPEPVRRNLPVIVALVLGILVSAAVDLAYSLKLSHYESELRQRRQRLRELSVYLKKAKETERKIKELKRIKGIIEKIIEEAHIPLRVIQAVEASIPKEVWVTELQLKKKKLTIKGYSLNGNRIADFLEKLSSSQLISKVKLSYIKKTEVNSVSVRQFSAEAVLR